MSTAFREDIVLVQVPEPALNKVRAVLRAVAAGEPVDTPSAAAEAAYALAALPPSDGRTS